MVVHASLRNWFCIHSKTASASTLQQFCKHAEISGFWLLTTQGRSKAWHSFLVPWMSFISMSRWQELKSSSYCRKRISSVTWMNVGLRIRDFSVSALWNVQAKTPMHHLQGSWWVKLQVTIALVLSFEASQGASMAHNMLLQVVSLPPR